MQQYGHTHLHVYALLSQLSTMFQDGHDHALTCIGNIDLRKPDIIMHFGMYEFTHNMQYAIRLTS